MAVRSKEESLGGPLSFEAMSTPFTSSSLCVTVFFCYFFFSSSCHPTLPRQHFRRCRRNRRARSVRWRRGRFAIDSLMARPSVNDDAMEDDAGDVAAEEEVAVDNIRANQWNENESIPAWS